MDKRQFFIDLGERVAATFLQGAVAALVASPLGFTKAALVGAVAGGLAAVKAYIVGLIKAQHLPPAVDPGPQDSPAVVP